MASKQCSLLNFFGSANASVDKSGQEVAEEVGEEREVEELNEADEPRGKKPRPKPKSETLAEWQAKHQWLFEKDGKMFCSICVKHKNNNSMTEGTTNFRKSTIFKSTL